MLTLHTKKTIRVILGQGNTEKVFVPNFQS